MMYFEDVPLVEFIYLVDTRRPGGSDVGGSDVGGSDVGGSDVGGSDVGDS